MLVNLLFVRTLLTMFTTVVNRLFISLLRWTADSILQRCCSIATGIPFARLRSQNLNITEWEKVAGWWANRYVDGQDRLKEYREHRDFSRLHNVLKNNCELLPTQQLDVVYDAGLTLSKIRSELDKKVKQMDVGVIIVDYINQVKRSSLPSRGGQYELDRTD